ncbi:hypothetical protein GCM10027195_30510 [Comamonas sediminis]
MLATILLLISIPAAWVAISAHFDTHPNDPLFTIFPAFWNWINGGWNVPRWLCLLIFVILIWIVVTSLLEYFKKPVSEIVAPNVKITSLDQLSNKEITVLFGFMMTMEAQGSSAFLIPKKVADLVNESVAQIEAAFLHLMDKGFVMQSANIGDIEVRYYLTAQGKIFIAAHEDELLARANSIEIRDKKSFDDM